MVHKGKPIPQCDLVNLLEATWYQTYVLESLLLEVFNQEAKYALMVCSNLKMAISLAPLIFVSLKLICDLLIQRIQPQ